MLFAALVLILMLFVAIKFTVNFLSDLQSSAYNVLKVLST